MRNFQYLPFQKIHLFTDRVFFSEGPSITRSLNIKTYFTWVLFFQHTVSFASIPPYILNGVIIFVDITRFRLYRFPEYSLESLELVFKLQWSLFYVPLSMFRDVLSPYYLLIFSYCIKKETTWPQKQQHQQQQKRERLARKFTDNNCDPNPWAEQYLLDSGHREGNN